MDAKPDIELISLLCRLLIGDFLSLKHFEHEISWLVPKELGPKRTLILESAMGFCGYLAGDDTESTNIQRGETLFGRYARIFKKIETKKIPLKNQKIYSKFYLYKHLGMNPVILDLFSLEIEAFQYLEK